MLGIDLSALSSAELARLMQVSQAKGQSEMTAELHREMSRRGGAPQPATAMTWSPVGFDRPAVGEAKTSHESNPRRTAVLAAVILGALAVSSGAGWWLTRAPAPTAAAPAPLPEELPAPAPAPATVAPIAAPALPPAASSSRARPVKAARPHRHATASHHRVRHHRAPPPRPRRRHGLFHRLTGWLRPDSSRD